MKKLKGLRLNAVVIKLVNEMEVTGSWCGETHIQKTAYFLQGLLEVPLTYEFIIYKHGPYSFELHGDLAEMRANRFIKTVPRDPYGPSFRQGDIGNAVTRRFPKTLTQLDQKIKFAAEELSGKRVAELERFATALYVTLNEPKGWELTASERARLVYTLKPHVSPEAAHIAVQGVDALREKAKEQNLIN